LHYFFLHTFLVISGSFSILISCPIYGEHYIFGNSTALAQNPNNLQVLFREYDSTLNYDCAQGTCQVVTSDREVAQQDIVLGVHNPSARQYTDYAIA